MQSTGAAAAGIIPAVAAPNLQTFEPAGVFWTAAHGLLVGLYLLAPLAVLGLAAWRHRKGQRAWGPAVTTWLGGIVLGGGLSLAYGQFIAGSVLRVSTVQVLLASYFAVGLLAILKTLDVGVQAGMGQLAKRYPRKPGPWTMRSWAAVILFARFLVLASIGLPFVMAAAMTYRVKVTPPETPAAIGNLPYATVQFEAADGVDLSGWWVPAPQGPGDSTVLVVPGLGSGKADLLPVVGFFVGRGQNVFIFDPRAHGDSGGQLTSFGDRERLDVTAAVRWVRTNRPAASRQIYGLGVSMGGAAVLAAAAAPDRPFDAVAVVDTYDDLSALAEVLVERQFRSAPPVRWVARAIALPLASAHAGRPLTRFRPADYTDHLWPTPLLVAHSQDDQLIPFAAGQRLYHAAEEPKRALWVDDLDHNEAMIAPKVLVGVAAFFDLAEGWQPLVSAAGFHHGDTEARKRKEL